MTYRMCRKGHEKTPENTTAAGACRACRRAWDRAHLKSAIRTNLCACGCGAMVARTWAVGHAPHMQARSLDGAYEVTEAGCWVWQRATTRGGYGVIRRDGRVHLAHRWFYEQHVGAIGDGLELDHLCSNPPCVNPAHLEPVTSAENTHRSRAARLTAEDVVEIRASAEGPTALGRRFGVGKRHIMSIRNGSRWAAV